MAHHLIKRFSQGERLIHWLQMLTFLLLVLTGVGLYAKSFFGLTRLFGGVDTSRAIHHYAGIVFIFSSVALFFQWFKDFTAPAEDSLGEVIRGYLDHNIHPKSGKMNAGQKLLGLCTGLFAVVMILTGLAMWFPFFLGRGMQQWMYF
ncbi:MAG: cytochrome b/b6 domain-containing protein, partial [bacterium]